MTTEKVEIAFDVEGNPSSPFITLNDPIKGILGSTDYVLGGSLFYDVTDKVKSVSVSRGKSRQLDQFTAGNASVVFNNQDRTFDPLYSGSPYAGQIIPRRPIRISTNQEVVPAGTVVNMATNPSFESIPLTTFTNFCPNPSIEADANNWFITGSATVARDTTQAKFGAASLRFNATAISELTYIDSSVTASRQYRASVYVKAEAGKSYRIVIEERTSSALVGSTASPIRVGSGQWERLTVGRSFGATGTVLRLYIQNQSSSAHTIYIDGVLVEDGSTAPPTSRYFDGDTTGIQDTTFSWSGTPHASTSIMQRPTNRAIDRTNFIINPSFELGTTGNWGGNGVSLVASTDYSYDRAWSLKGTITVDNPTFAYIDYVPRFSAVAGRIYTSSIYVYNPVSNGVTIRARAEFHPYTGSAFLPAINGSYVDLVPGQWTRLSITATAPATATSMLPRFSVERFTGQINKVLYYDAALAEETSALNPYFDGETEPQGDFYYEWSADIQSAVARRYVSTVDETTAVSAVACLSKDWSSTNSHSLRVRSTTTSISSNYARIDVSGFTVGQQYTFSIKARLTAPLTGTLGSNARQVSIRDTTLAGSSIVGFLAAPNVAGVHDLRIVFTSNATTQAILLYNGSFADNGDIWFDDLIITAGNYVDDYFDGSSAALDRYATYSWSGTPNASTSIKTQSSFIRGIVFTGLIDDWDLTYTTNGESIASLRASDGLSLVSNQNLVPTVVPQEFAGQRIDKILSTTLVNWPLQERFLNTGNYLLQSQTIENATNALQYIQKVAESDNGSFFIGKDGTATYLESRTPDYWRAVLFSDDGEGIPYANLSVVYGSELLYNNFVLTRLGAETLNVSYPDSKEEYGTYSLNKDGLLLQNASDMVNLALELGARYSQPEYRFESIMVNLTSLSEFDQTRVLALELGSIVQVVFTPNGIGDPINQYATVTGIDHMASPLVHNVRLKLAAL